MDLFRNMRAFARVVDNMSFSGAAKSLGVGTGQVSRQISELEAHLRTRLLHRTTRHIALTHAGRDYLEHVRSVLSAIDRAESAAREAHGQPVGRLHVSASPAIGRHFLVPAIRDYQQSFPNVQITMTLSFSPQHLLEDDYDIAVVALPTPLPSSSFVGVLLGATHSVLCAAPSYVRNHPLINEAGDLSTHDFVGNVSSVVNQIQLNLVGPIGRERTAARSMLSINSESAVASALEIGMGVGSLPVHTAIDAIRSGRLVRVLPQYELDHVNIYALFPSTRYLDPKVRTWLDFLKSFFAKRVDDRPSQMNAAASVMNDEKCSQS